MIVAAVCLTHSCIYGKKVPIEEAITRIASYPLSFVLKTISRMSLILEGPVSEIEQKQVELCQRLLEPEQAFLIDQAVRNRAYEDKYLPRINGVEEKTIIFSRAQLAVATKIAILYCDEDNTERKELRWKDFVDALLIINDHLGPYWTGEPSIFQIINLNMQFQLTDPTANYIARWYDLTLKILELSKNTEFANLDLEERYKTSHTLTIQNYISLGLALYATWVSLPRKSIDEGSIHFGVDLLKNKIKIPSEEFESGLKEFSRTPVTFKERVTRENAIDPYDNLTLLQTPLLRLDNSFFCLDTNFFLMKIGEGFYHTLVRLFESKNKNIKEIQGIRNLLGRAFEKYTLEIFERIFNSSRAKRDFKRFIPGDALPKRLRENQVDGFIDYGHSMVVVEVKSALVPLEAKTSMDTKGFESWETKTIIKAAEQIENVIDKTKRGKLKLPDEYDALNPSDIKMYYPLIITLQSLPLASPDYRNHIKRRVKSLLQATDIAPLEIMNISDLEQAEIAISEGVSFLDLIKRKISQEVHPDWGAYLGTYKSVNEQPTNPHLKSIIDEIVEKGIPSIFHLKETT